MCVLTESMTKQLNKKFWQNSGEAIKFVDPLMQRKLSLNKMKNLTDSAISWYENCCLIKIILVKSLDVF